MIFRYARHTDNLERIAEFYKEILNFQVLGEFRDHNGYDGIFLGMEGPEWHLEFTVSPHPADHKSDEDDLLVFYPSSEREFQVIRDRIRKNKVEEVAAKNPYWNDKGVMILDPDGFRIVISSARVKGDL